MKNSLLAYKIGLAGIGIFVISLVVYVGAQAGATKQDTQTYKAASDISQKLDTYVDERGSIPNTLDEAGIHNVPSAIKYTKLSDSSYKFCVTYKARDDGFDSGPSLIETLAVIDSPIPNRGGADTMLFISPAHKKGENCQTITPLLLPSDFSSGGGSDPFGGNSFSNPSNTYPLTDPIQVD